jgi:hypothetical protein
MVNVAAYLAIFLPSAVLNSSLYGFVFGATTFWTSYIFFNEYLLHL